MKMLAMFALVLGSATAFAGHGDGYEYYDSSHLPNNNPSSVVTGMEANRDGFEYQNNPNMTAGKPRACRKGERMTLWIADATNSRDVLVTYVCHKGRYVRAH